MLFKFFFVKIKAFIFYKDSDYKHFLIFFVSTETKAKTYHYSNVLGTDFAILMIEFVVYCGMSIILEILSSFCSAGLIAIALRIYNNIRCFCFCCYVISANLYFLLKNIIFLSLIVAYLFSQFNF